MADDIRLAAYQARIGLGGALRPDLATLTAIHAAHVAAIPFESLDPFLRRPVRLNVAALQDKMVDHRRGGYCFEQNTLFKAMLEAIGFDVTGLGARVRWASRPESPLGARVHMALKVDLPEGPHLADVGFGGACVLDQPLQLRTGLTQRTPMGTYRLREEQGMFALDAMQPGGWRTPYVFNLEPQLPSDYDMASWFSSQHPNSGFLTTLLLERVGGGARHKLINRRHIVETRDGAVVSETALDDVAAFARVLDEEFDVEPPAPVEEIFARLPA
jgi:N-hydroxyarylamine O-acetyltransferase